MGKIKKFIEQYKLKELSDKKKIENLVFLLIMLVLAIIGINVIWFGDKEENDLTNVKVEKASTILPEENLELKLEKILEKVNGVKSVSVLITYKNDKTIIPIYNIEDNEKIINEQDNGGGTRQTTEKLYSKEVVMEQNNNIKNIVVSNQINSEINGIIVVANYNNDNSIKQQIIESVAVVAGISQYKVQVLSGEE